MQKKFRVCRGLAAKVEDGGYGFNLSYGYEYSGLLDKNYQRENR